MKIKIPVNYDGLTIRATRMINPKNLNKYKKKYPDLEIVEKNNLNLVF